jgi:hypothetical protein
MNEVVKSRPRTLTDDDIRAYQRRIESLAFEANRLCGCSHDYYVDLFSEAVEGEFDPEDAPFWEEMMPFLRQRDYATPEERRIAEEQREEEGYCSHGLTFWTCPAGCFEG